MSHISTYKQKITNTDLFLQVVKRLGGTIKQETTSVQMFGSQTVENAIAAIHLDGWRYDIALTKDGGIQYDNFGSIGNSMDQLYKVMQTYSFELIKENIPLEVNNYLTEYGENEEIILDLEYK